MTSSHVPAVKKVITNFREINANLQINNLKIDEKPEVKTVTVENRENVDEQDKKGKKDKKKKTLQVGGFY